MTKIKNFFNNPKGLFVGVTGLMWLSAFGLVALGSLSYGAAMASLGSITVGVVALYQWYTKNQEISLMRQTVKQVSIESQNIKERNTKLDNINKSMASDMFRMMEKLETGEKAKEVRKPKATKARTTKSKTTTKK